MFIIYTIYYLIFVSCISSAKPTKPLYIERNSNETVVSCSHIQANGTDNMASYAFQRLFCLNTAFWDSFMVPLNTIQAKNINSTIFADNVIGRVDASRTLYGTQLNTEYVFGSFSTLASRQNSSNLLGAPVRHQLTHFATTGNIVSTAEIVWFDCSIINKSIPVEVDGWFGYTPDGRIIEYDITFRWLEWTINYIIEVFIQHNGLQTTKGWQLLRSGIITEICATASQYCVGSLQQYQNSDECFEFLLKNIRFGKAYEFGMNTLLCRSLHELMVPLRPSVHCPHIGPGGGNMCIDDLSYKEKVLQHVFGEASFIPNGSIEKNLY